MLSKLAPRWGGSYEAIEKLLEETRPYVDKNIELAPLMGYLDYTKALDEISADRLVQSIAYSSAAIEHGNKAYYFQRRADAYYRLDNFNAAMIDYSNAIALYPYDSSAFVWRGLAYEQLGRLDFSLQDLTRAAKLRPFDYRARKNFGTALLKEERYEEAVESFYAAMHYKKDDDYLWYYTGWYLSHRLKRHQEALESFSQATSLKPNKPSYWYETVIALNEFKGLHRHPCDAEIPATLQHPAWLRLRKSAVGERHIGLPGADVLQTISCSPGRRSRQVILPG